MFGEVRNVSANVKLFDRGQLKAFVDLTITLTTGEITLFGFRVIHDGVKAPWVANPTISYEKGGKTLNKSIVEMSRSLQPIFLRLILDEYKKCLELQKGHNLVPGAS